MGNTFGNPLFYPERLFMGFNPDEPEIDELPDFDSMWDDECRWCRKTPCQCDAEYEAWIDRFAENECDYVYDEVRDAQLDLDL